jgi:SPP1 family predicted phage head-tail adaptor
MSGLPIGALRHRLRVETPIDVEDDFGGFVRTYRVMTYLWARVSAINATEQFIEQRFEQATNFQVDLRWRSDIIAGMRFIFGKRILLIRGVREADGAKRFLTCACEEIT